MAKKEVKVKEALESGVMLSAEEVIVTSEAISKSKTAGVFSPEKNVKWVKLHRMLKKAADEAKEALEDLQRQHDIVFKDGRIDFIKTGEQNWMTYQSAYQLMMKNSISLELERFLSDDEVYALKDKNDYTTEFMEFLINYLGVKEDGDQVN